MSVFTQLDCPREARPLKIALEAIYTSSFIIFLISSQISFKRSSAKQCFVHSTCRFKSATILKRAHKVTPVKICKTTDITIVKRVSRQVFTYS